MKKIGEQRRLFRYFSVCLQGMISETESIGNYGPYIQSERKEIYQCYAKDLIERNLSNLDFLDLFIDCDIDLIMDDIENILAGNVSERWLKNFVNALKD